MNKVLLETQEIESLKKIQEELSLITTQLGEIQIQMSDMVELKSQVLKNLTKVREKQQQLGTTLSTKYGQGTIDLNSGEFTKSN